MANAIVTIKIMPESPEIDLKSLETQAKEKITAFAGEGETRTEIEPIAFGLKAVKITFVMDEKLGSPDKVSEEISALEGVNSAEVVDVRRAIG
ncbi:MAG: elongation factor 1-beta [Nanoarchaeota archaeon]|nr:elongation factor 1-beta [Nanoarchaeota archaeon]MBU1269996.1 elongation factor 1-beta [Nanoarchaeota archaeon]MBU1603975.1 elongation factor 1-beta [Nanoarchaeota archaeon]MBU2443168.1 elongation factor 1-beta [Nanoarchaeota archaeon]